MRFRSFIYALLMVVFGVAGFQSAYAATYADDSLVVRGILDANGYTERIIESVSHQRNGRINALSFYKLTDLDSIPNTIALLDSLDTLKIISCNLTYVSGLIADLDSLKYVDLSKNTNLSDDAISVTLSNMENMEYLNIQGCSKIANLYSNQVGKLKYLNISSTRITLFREGFVEDNPDLEKLIADSSYLNMLPDDIGGWGNMTYLSLGSCNLVGLPDQICDLSNLETLEVSGNYLVSLPDSIGKLSNLRDFRFSGNKIDSLPSSIGNLSRLNTIELNDNELTHLPETISGLDSISYFRVDSNNLTTVPEGITGMERLSFLSLNDNPLDSLPDAIGQCKELEIFFAQRTNLTTLPQGFADLDSLHTFYGDSSSIAVLPDNFGSLKNLTYLSLSSCNLTSLPESFKDLQKLSYLEVNNNQLTDENDMIMNLPVLSELRIKNNKLTTVTTGPSLKKLYADSNEITEVVLNTANVLEYLYLSNNKITSIDSTMLGQQIFLTTLDLSNNYLEHFPRVKTGDVLDQLRNLVLNNNNITTFGSGMEAFTSLSSINLNNNSISTVSDSLINVTTLNTVKLDSNNIVDVPPALLKLNFVYTLSLAGNRIAELGEEVGGLNGVKSFNLSGNRLTSIPDTLFRMVFSQLYLSDNELLTLPELVDTGLSSISTMYLNNNNLEDLPLSFIETGWNSRYTNRYNFNGNRLCQNMSPEIVSWMDTLVVGWQDGQNCTAPDNPIVFTEYSKSADGFVINWDTVHVNDTDLEFSTIAFRNDRYQESVFDTEATVVDTYAVFDQFSDTVSEITAHKRYYFSAFVRDCVNWWSDSAALAQMIISTHELTLNDMSQVSDSSGMVSVSYKVFNTDSEDSTAALTLFYRNGTSASWSEVSFSSGDTGSVVSNDSLDVKIIYWNALSQLGNDFVSDSLQLMLTASAQFDLVDTLAMAEADFALDFTTIPENAFALSATAISESQIDLTWSKSVSTDVEYIYACYNSDGSYPASYLDAEKSVQLAEDVEACSFDSLLEKRWYNFALFVVDSAGNISPVDSSAQDSARTFDVTPSDDIKSLNVENLTYSSMTFKWVAPDSTDAESILVVFNTDTVTALADTFSNQWMVIPVTADSIIFDSLQENTAYYTGFFVVDSVGNWSSGAFKKVVTTKIGNQLSQVELSDVMGEHSGDVEISMVLSDSDQDTLNVSFQYSIDGLNWNTATITGEISDLTYSDYNGVVLSNMWNSEVDLAGFDIDSVYFTAVPYDSAAGIKDTVIIALDNYHGQKANISSPLGVQNGDVTFLTSVTDTSGDTSTLSYFYSLDNGAIWQDAANITVAGDSVVWHTDSVFKNINVSNIEFKVVANDGWQDGVAGITDTFSVQNLTTYMTGDYDKDGKIAFSDFSYVASYWNLSAGGVKDPEALNELAPSTGTAPYLTVTPDSLFNYEDLAVFVKMFYWSKHNIDSSSRIAANRSLDNSADFTVEQVDSTVTIDLTFDDLENIVAVRYRLLYDNDVLARTETAEGEFLKRGEADLFSVKNSAAGLYSESSARISSGDLSVSGSGSIGAVVFNHLADNGTSITVEYELINSEHEVAVSGREKIDINSVPQNSRILEVVPSVSVVADLFEGINAENRITVDMADWKRESGFNIYIDIPDTITGEDISGSVKVLNFLGDIIIESDFSGSAEEFSEPFVMYWSGHSENGVPLSSGAYVVLLRYTSGSKSRMFKTYIGIKK